MEDFSHRRQLVQNGLQDGERRQARLGRAQPCLAEAAASSRISMAESGSRRWGRYRLAHLRSERTRGGFVVTGQVVQSDAPHHCKEDAAPEQHQVADRPRSSIDG